ncbi:MAG: hypothetical protein A3D24_02235 [Candidatus Blackburnbacteria bacterium RIFCSPHIGHO2_02_FULL_39_13]|uniref:Uncharacterized protein n=1 Tax=Candidatus Blackburnbacteria bacterium RIFCSPLOWO2_01_FULL_40_20 TaxID=1797519 RepID=A0A1G1VAP0_9BACT|nr:MAG: hypothetical protein A2694_02945 [Candidatus Blackburnbacteria bacterium RIFCSPHIGHO2_01_FULL_40_17]OGY09501.1 MAG: hypothetical protein A3D24_02235 [Candidatus Blackburnbacteria bacterium RIFCSPHIGHO2_02_FULL_39_13]OGY12515.1 MAG: hypothetical protein A3A77_00905 [Candidatus Blackburnbacteria bacterium RIFCSPLOWO2_01_FULL_40_20]OGY15122.1 MAG: hypothetical protein A3I52_00020 [Candidatus Blackburnbacteria bacterium RIFCSPLOWO2_02_FULL_40_10]HBL51659.1 hypothetical protein [Candidatus B
MVTKVFQDFPNFKKQLIDFDNLYAQLKKRRVIKTLPRSTGNKKKDLYSTLAHYINIIHLKLIHQLQLLILGINSENPEVASIVRSCIETIGALAYITNKITPKKTDYEFIWELLYVATMGQNTKTMSGKITFSNAPQSIHTADYVREINKLLNIELDRIGSENKDYILESYDFLSEFTHPNYLALQVYWRVDHGELIYDKKIACLREEELSQILLTTIPLILVYEMTLRKAEKLEQEFVVR